MVGPVDCALNVIILEAALSKEAERVAACTHRGFVPGHLEK